MTISRTWSGLLALATLAGCGGETTVTVPPPEVSVARPIERQVTESLDFTGRTDAIETVDVRARVSGYITKVHFTDGAMVKAGDVLFEIDPREYQEAVARVEGELVRLRALLTRGESEVSRTQRLRPSGAASEREVEQAIASKQSAEGEIMSAKANLAAAKLDLEFTRVVAPIAGRASRAAVTAGNLVTIGAAGGAVLTTIVTVTPIYVYFDVDERSVLRYRKAALQGVAQVTPETVRERHIPVRIGLADEKGHPHEGMLDFIDNRVDPATGTIRARGVFDNASGYLAPGMFVRVRLPFGEPHPSLLVTDRAIGTDQDRKYVLVVNDQSVVEYRQVQLGPIVDGMRVVNEGVTAGDRVIVNGIQRARPGQTVAPVDTAMAQPTGSAAPPPAAS